MMVHAAAMVMLCSRAFDASATTTLIGVSAMLLAVALAVGLPGRMVRAAQWVALRLGLRRIVVPGLAAAAATRVGPEEARAMSHLAATLAFVAAGFGLLGALALQGASAVMRLLEHGFIYPGWVWGLITFALALTAMLPMGLGVSVALLSHAVLRRGSGRDVYAGVFREWVWSAAAGFAVLAVLWWSGANLLYVGFGSVVSLAGAGAALTQRKRTAVRLRRPLSPVAAPSPLRRLAVAACWAAVAVVLLSQIRLLEALTGACVGGKSAWLAVSMAMLAAAIGRSDARSHAPSVRQLLAACIVLGAGLLMQFSLLMAAVAARVGGSVSLAVVAGLTALAAQAPLAAGAGMIISAHRRRFASAGRQGRQYISTVAGGAGAGAVGYLLFAPSPGGMLAAATALLLCAGAVVALIGNTRRPVEQVRWAVWGGVLLLGLTTAVVAAVHELRTELGRGTIGAWLMDEGDGPRGVAGVARSPAVTAELDALLRQSRGRWWVVAGSAADVPDQPWGVSMSVSAPDVSAAGAELRQRLSSGAEGGWFQAMRGHPPQYDGLVLSPMPADHGGAWRCYSVETLSRSVRLVHPGGVVAVRVRSSDARVLLRVVHGFAGVVGDGWVAVAATDGGLDALIVGPPGAAEPPRRQGLTLVSVHDLSEADGRAGPVRLIAPGGIRLRGRGHDELLDTLGELAGERP